MTDIPLDPVKEFVYPGHPATVAAWIMQVYPSLAHAERPAKDGQACSSALVSIAIPGAPQNVALGLQFLQRLRTDPYPVVLRWANEQWKSMTVREFRANRSRGQSKALEHLRVIQQQRAAGWSLERKEESQDPAEALESGVYGLG